MNYTVTYKPSAEQELADIWMNAPNRQAVTEAAHRIDFLLKTKPHEQGESRDGNTRIMFERPLAVDFEIHDEDCRVEVLKVAWIGE